MKIIKKILIGLIIILQAILLIKGVNACEIGEEKSLERGPLGYYCVQKWNGSNWIYLTYNTTYYTDVNGQKYVAYCLSPGAPGVGYVSGEADTYNVKVNKLIDDDRVWRIIKNGYPYKSIQELGVETVDDAYFATMQAANCVLRGYTLEEAKNLYSVGQFAINGENFEDVQRRGEKTLNRMFALLEIGLNGTEKRSDLLEIDVKKVSDFVKENDNYYSQTFKIESKSDIKEYSIEKIENMPNGSYVADMNGNKKTNFSKAEQFKIFVPTKEIKKDINGKIIINVKQKNFPIYYGQSEKQGFQDYALCSEEITDVKASAEINIKANNSNLKIIKVDGESKKPLKGVKFEVTSENNKIGEYVTDENGKIEIQNLNPGIVKIKEIETVPEYKLLNDVIEINLLYGDIKEIQVENELKKGNIKIVKVDYDNQDVRLGNIKFEVKDLKGNVIAAGKTDENGELVFKDIKEGNYKVYEVEPLEGYMLQENEYEISIKPGETVEKIIKNKKIEKVIEIVEVEKIVEIPVEVEKEVEKIVEVPVEVEKVIYKELPKTGNNEINIRKAMKSLMYVSSFAIYIFIKFDYIKV